MSEEELAGSGADEAYVTATDEDEEEEQQRHQQTVQQDEEEEEPSADITTGQRNTLQPAESDFRRYSDGLSITPRGSTASVSSIHSGIGGRPSDVSAIDGDSPAADSPAAEIEDGPILPVSNGQLSTVKSDTLISVSGGTNDATLKPMESLFSIRTASTTVESRSQAVSLTADLSAMDLGVGLFGPSQSGKSSLIQRYMTNTMPSEYEPTIEDHYSRQLVFPRYDRQSGRKIALDSPSSGDAGSPLIGAGTASSLGPPPSSATSAMISNDSGTSVSVNLRLLDTSGSSDHRSLMGSWIRHIGENGVFVFVFSLTSREQFSRIEDYIKTVLSFDFSLKATTIVSMSDTSTIGAGLPNSFNRSAVGGGGGFTITSQNEGTTAVGIGGGSGLSKKKKSVPFEVRGEKHCILVGSQCDLEERRRVTTDEARKLAVKYFGNESFYLECSSYENRNVEALMELAFKLTQIDYVKKPLKIGQDSDLLKSDSGSSKCCVIL